MRIGFVVDGEAEFASLKLVLPQIQAATGHTLLSPLLAKMPPLAPVGTIARTCAPRLRVLEGKGVNRTVVLMDRETRRECPGTLASLLAQQLSRFTSVDTCVVIKDAMFENWLVADHTALGRQSGRFRIGNPFRRAVEPDRADRADALALMKEAVRGDYDKVADARRILNEADVLRIGRNSRSFRRLLRVLEHPVYAEQSVRRV